jgi:tetratricopeptide (TPR) repeat protein
LTARWITPDDHSRSTRIIAVMPSGLGERYDFFLSRRGPVAPIAREVTDVLTEKGYRVRVQDYDIPIGASFVEVMHEAVKNSRDLIVLFTRDYELSPYTRKEFTSFEAERAQSAEERHIIVLRCEDAPLRGLLADSVYQDLVGIEDPQERKRRIIAAAERQSQGAPPPLRPFIGVPPRIASFTGRADKLDRLDAILMHDKPAAVTQAVGRAAVQGLGGVGKTSLAIEYAHRYRNLFAGVCWCPAETRTGLLSALAALAVTLGAATADEADVEKAAKAALRRLDEQRATWLLVYDNVSSPDEIADLLPSFGARVLITSRFSDWGGMADEVALDVLSPEEAIAFLQSRSGRREALGARTLARALGYLPLALDHAAAYCKRTQMSFDNYAAAALDLVASVPRGANYPRSVAATFELAISDAVLQDGGAEHLMGLLAYFAPERIPLWLLERSVEGTPGLSALTALAEVSLVRNDPFDDGTPAVTVHRLVQAITRQKLVRLKTSGAAIKRVTRLLADAFPENARAQPHLAARYAALLPHAVGLREHALRGDKDPPRAMARLLDAVGNYVSWSNPHGKKWWPSRVKSSPEPIARTLLRLAWQLFYAGRYSEAESLFHDAVAIAQRSRDLDTLQSSHWGLATLLKVTDRLEEAQVHQRDALSIKQDAFFQNYTYAVSNLEMANTLLDTGRPSEALAFGQHALAVTDQLLGKTHDSTKAMASVVVVALDALGRAEEAKELRERYGLEAVQNGHTS